MMTISPDNAVFTVVAILKVKPADQEKFLEAFKASIQWMRKREGFVAAALHQSVDGKTILNYLQWRSQADFEAYISRPTRTQFEREFLELLAQQGYAPPDRGPYEVVLVAEKSE